MKLDEFLECKKVRCVKAYGDCLTVGKEYGVIDIRMEVKVKDDEGDNYYWESDHFEPVVDDELPKSAENPLQDMKLTPGFEAVEPKFKVGDKVYYGSEYRILTIAEFDENGWIRPEGWIRLDRLVGFINDKKCCHATQENYEMLCNLYPHIEFEQPPKELKGSDLCRAMLEKGWKFVPCYVHDESDDEAMNRKHYVSVKKETPKSGYNFSSTGANDWKYAVPIDPRTGEPLTEAVLDE